MRLVVVPWLPSANKNFKTWAITIAPYVFILPQFKDNPAILAHEQVHLDRIASVGWIKWYWNYLWNKDFRRREEDAGYMVQRITEMNGGKG